jgi:hypothetical protein
MSAPCSTIRVDRNQQVARCHAVGALAAVAEPALDRRRMLETR